MFRLQTLVTWILFGSTYCAVNHPAPPATAGTVAVPTGDAAKAAKMVVKVQGKPGDIRPFRSLLVRLHNDYRRSEGSSNMKLLVRSKYSWHS